jgi:hypothetical protein
LGTTAPIGSAGTTVSTWSLAWELYSDAVSIKACWGSEISARSVAMSETAHPNKRLAIARTH